MSMSVSMSPEGLLRAGASSRVEKLLGSLPHNNLSSPAAPSEAGDLNELREEDVWDAWVEGSNPWQESPVKEETLGGVGRGFESPARSGGIRLQLQQQQQQQQVQPQMQMQPQTQLPPPQQRWLGFETGAFLSPSRTLPSDLGSLLLPEPRNLSKWLRLRRAGTLMLELQIIMAAGTCSCASPLL